MRRINTVPLCLALASGPLVLLLQHWVRPAFTAGSTAWWLLGATPSLIIGLCVPFVVVIRTTYSPLGAARAFTLACLGTFALLILVEVAGTFRGSPFSPMDIAAGIAGLTLSALLYRRLAPHLLYAERPLT